VCLAGRCDDDAWRWHERFGHLNFEALKQLSNKEMVQGMPRVEHVEQFCDSCVLTKQWRLPFPRQASFRAKEKLELMHGDLCGPVTLATPGGWRFFLLLVDDMSRYMWAVLLDTKAAATDAIKLLRRSAATSFGCYAPTTAASSRRTAPMRGSSATSPRCTLHSRTALLSTATRRWWLPPAPSTSREGFRQSTEGRR
jgi:hypothetical protein